MSATPGDRAGLPGDLPATSVDPNPKFEKVAEDDESITYRVRSRTNPRIHYAVLLNKATGLLTCTCEGFTHHGYCWMVPQRDGQKPHKRQSRSKKAGPGPAGERSAHSDLPKAPSPHIAQYHDLVTDWENTALTIEELMGLDAEFRSAVLTRHSTRIWLRLVEIEYGAKLVFPAGYTRGQFMKEAPTPASVIRQSLTVAKKPDAPWRQEWLDREPNQKERQQMIAHILRPGEQQAELVIE